MCAKRLTQALLSDAMRAMGRRVARLIHYRILTHPCLRQCEWNKQPLGAAPKGPFRRHA
jgi:hypothetical protein